MGTIAVGLVAILATTIFVLHGLQRNERGLERNDIPADDCKVFTLDGFVPATDWTYLRTETYDSSAGWWTSDSTGIKIYFDRGVPHIVGVVAGPDARRGRFEGRDFHWARRATQQGDQIVVTFECKESQFGPVIVNLFSLVNLALTEDQQIRHMLWRSLALVPSTR